MTLAKYRKKLGRELKREFGLPHVLAFRLAKMASYQGQTLLGLVLESMVSRFGEGTNKVDKVEKLLLDNGFALTKTYSRCCSDPSHGDEMSEVSVMPLPPALR